MLRTLFQNLAWVIGRSDETTTAKQSASVFRSYVTAVRGQRPRPLDERDSAAVWLRCQALGVKRGRRRL